MRSTRPLAALTIVALLVTACAGAATPAPTAAPTAAPTSAATSAATTAASPAAANLEDAVKAQCAKGEQEGTMSFVSSISANAWPKYAAEFAKVAPKIAANTTYQNMNSEDNARRILAEAQTGKGTVDVIYNDAYIVQNLIDAGVLNTSFDWKSFGVPEDTIKGPTVRVFRTTFGLVFNKSLLKAEDLPSTWDDVINAKWAGRAVAHLHADGIKSLVLIWGIEKMTKWANDFKTTVKPKVIDGATAGILTVASGENLFTTAGRDDSLREQQAKGAPIDIKYLDIVPTGEPYSAVIKNAAHPQAAACWVMWLASKAGRDALAAIDFKFNDTVPKTGVPSNAKLASVNTAADATLVNQAGDVVSKILTP
jgi:ABC-type Fe3+ transport system substrate-binding protein